MRSHRSLFSAEWSCVFALLLGTAITPPPAAAITINFSDFSEPGSDFRDLGTVVTHDGFQFDSTPGAYGGTLGVWQDDCPNHPEGGSSSTSLLEFYGYAITTMTAINSNPFSLSAIDLAPYRISDATGTFDVIFAGTQVDGSTVQQVFTVSNSSGATPVLRRFYFAGFTDMVSVTFQQGVAPGPETAYQFNNVTVSDGTMSIVGNSPVVRLGAARPNPSRSTVAVQVRSLARGNLQVEVFSADGRWMRSLRWVAGGGDGWTDLVWNGLDERGAPVPTGVYFVRGTGPRAENLKVVIVR
jgi:hypothetical protein